MPLPLLALAAASAFVLPKADVKLATFIQSHSPKSVDREGKWAACEIEVFVDPKGKVLECTPKRIVGDAELARTMCSLTIGKRMSPARDFSGIPVHGLSRMVVGVSPGSQPNPYGRLGKVENERLEITLSRLPSGNSAPILYGINLAIDETGAVKICRSSIKFDATLEGIACSQAVTTKFTTKIGSAGEPVTYIRSLVVEFIEGS